MSFRLVKRITLVVVLLASACTGGTQGIPAPLASTPASTQASSTDPLPSWNEGSTKNAIFKLPEIDFVDDKEGKPVGILNRIGRRPIAAFGNSDGDLQMLQWTMAGSGARFALFVHHDDAEREFAYDRTARCSSSTRGGTRRWRRAGPS